MAISSYMLALKTIKIVHLCVVLRNGKLPYDNMDNLLSLSREGGITSSRKGIVDNLSMTYDGNMLASVSDSAPAPSVTGSADFRGGMSGNAGAHPVEGGVSVAGGSLEIGGETGGMELARPGASQPYRFLGNELYTSNSLGLYDFSARMYDPALGRFLSVDPMAERYYSMNPFTYCEGNPAIYADPDGQNPIIGALIGAGIDYSFQVYNNIKDGKRGKDAFWDNINFVSILKSAITPGKKMKAAAKVGLIVTGNLADAMFEVRTDGIKMNKDAAKVIETTILGSALDAASGGLGDYLSTGSAKATANSQKASYKAIHDRNIAGNSPTSTKAQKKAASSEAAAQVARETEIASRIVDGTYSVTEPILNNAIKNKIDNEKRKD